MKDTLSIDMGTTKDDSDQEVSSELNFKVFPRGING